MSQDYRRILIDELKPFDRGFFSAEEKIAYIGSGAIGGKASGLAFISDILTATAKDKALESFNISIPKLVVLPTDIFDRFMEHNRLLDIAHSNDIDDVIGNEFLKAELPPEMVGDLRGLIADVNTPLAVRSSSMLEDDLHEPFAGVYATKMMPNNQPDTDTRFRKLADAIKLVYASTFFKEAKDYITSTGHSIEDEKMAVIIQ
jgi:phosphoenolpyruvate synthase/pyruvate phosphate dikinase